jgi:hypothetical protein
MEQSKRWWRKNFSLVSFRETHPFYLTIPSYEELPHEKERREKIDDKEAILLSKMKDRPYWQASCVELLVYPFGATRSTRNPSGDKDSVVVYLEEVRAFVKKRRARVPPYLDHTQERFADFDEKVKSAEQKLLQMKDFQRRIAVRAKT